ncbi:zinc-ribbon domain containing protein [Candidatus Berkelbacteria bacterium]|nr:zinc-ribbon domain containing protein [Candidatus Berkelbacteria bacterium]
MAPSFDDKQMTCKDCSKSFVWTAGEQQFFAQKGFQNPPSRCPDCRRLNKQARQGERRQMYPIVCSDCGKAGEVPFQRRDPSSPVYCTDCFRSRRGINEGDMDSKPAADTDDRGHEAAETEEPAAVDEEAA